MDLGYIFRNITGVLKPFYHFSLLVLPPVPILYPCVRLTVYVFKYYIIVIKSAYSISFLIYCMYTIFKAVNTGPRH